MQKRYWVRFFGLAVLAVLVSCQNPIARSDSAAKITIPENLPFRELSSGAYRGGKMLYSPAVPEVNQLFAGLVVPIRLANMKESQDSTGWSTYADDPGSKVFGSLVVTAIGNESASFNAKTYTATGNELSSRSFTLTETTPADLNSDGKPDLLWRKVTDRAGLEGAHYLEFVNSKETLQVTMYQLDPKYYGGRLPFGIMSITPSGRFLINAKMDKTAQRALVDRSVAVPTYLVAGDVVFNGSQQIAAFISPKRELVESPSGATSKDSILINAENYHEYRDVLDRAGSLWEVLELDLANADISKMVQSESNDSDARFDWSWDTGGEKQSIYSFSKSYLGGTVTGNIGVGFHLEGSLNIRWLAVDYGLKYYQYYSANVALSFGDGKNSAFEADYQPLVSIPTIAFSAWGVPIEIESGRIFYGYKVNGSLAKSATVSAGFMSKAGLGMAGTLDTGGLHNNFAPILEWSPQFAINNFPVAGGTTSTTISQSGDFWLRYEAAAGVAGVAYIYAGAKLILNEGGNFTIPYPVTASNPRTATFNIGAQTDLYGGVQVGKAYTVDLGWFGRYTIDLSQRFQLASYTPYSNKNLLTFTKNF